MTRPSLVDAASSTDFEGGGATNRSGALTAIVTSRIAEVLPNGDMVLEGIREIEINGDRQMLLLTGIVPDRRTSGPTTSCYHRPSDSYAFDTSAKG